MSGFFMTKSPNRLLPKESTRVFFGATVTYRAIEVSRESITGTAKVQLQKAAAFIRARRGGSKRHPKDHPWRRKTRIDIRIASLRE
jgi:hypothetical protein